MASNLKTVETVLTRIKGVSHSINWLFDNVLISY